MSHPVISTADWVRECGLEEDYYGPADEQDEEDYWAEVEEAAMAELREESARQERAARDAARESCEERHPFPAIEEFGYLASSGSDDVPIPQGRPVVPRWADQDPDLPF